MTVTPKAAPDGLVFCAGCSNATRVVNCELPSGWKIIQIKSRTVDKIVCSPECEKKVQVLGEMLRQYEWY